MPSLDQADVLWREFAAIHGHDPDAVLTDAEREAIRRDARADAASASPDLADAAERIAVYERSVAARPTAQAALCLSGGGVRSAAFCLGVLQGLAARGLLSQFHYLSTVSGGGYIGAWLMAWAHRTELSSARAAEPGEHSAFERVEAALAQRDAFAAREPGPIEWLRRNQRFLTPRAGLLSSDGWAGGALFLRDLLMNWLVFLPALLASMLVPRILEMQLVWWAAFARDAGSAAGWMAVNGLHAVGLMPSGVPMPGWRGWVEVAPMAMAFPALVRRFQVRACGRGLSEGGFTKWVLVPIFGAAWMFCMSAAVVLANGVVPDQIMLLLWTVGVPGLVVLARLTAELWARAAWRQPGHGRNMLWDLLCLGVAGASYGAVVWTFMWIRSVDVFGAGSVRDIAVFGLPSLIVGAFLAQALYTGLACRLPFGRAELEWTGRAAGLLLLGGTIWAGGSSLVLYGDPLRNRLAELLAVLGISGALTLGGAVSAITKANAMLTQARKVVSVGVIIEALAVLFVLSGTVLLTRLDVMLVQAVSAVIGADTWPADRIVRALDPSAVDDDPATLTARLTGHAGAALLVLLGTATTLIVASLLMSMIVDVNLFSLHALYRNRLVRTFLGASNLESVTGKAPHRNTFDGFDDSDDVKLNEIWRGAAAGTETRRGPFPVINMALNLVSGSNLAWQDRKAAPFVATPFHLGGALVGYMGHDPNHLRRHLTLGTAMAVSGAAASPNWGYHSSPVIGFLMTLFNVRLGWWLENPRRVGDLPFMFRSFRLFAQEAFGLTRDQDPYLYLSDGGHFDNLGLYEMCRRRCRLIMVADASQDADMTLTELGRSLRQIRIDFGISVRFDELPFTKPGETLAAGSYATLGTITYPEGGPNGVLIYLKPGLFPDAPADVRAFGAANPSFPNDSTFNQWFTEAQFESYRALGQHATEVICGRSVMANQHLCLSDLPKRVARSAHRPER